MAELSRRQRAALARLGPVLEAHKAADVNAFAEARARLDAIQDRIDAASRELRGAADHLVPGDFRQLAAYEGWRLAQKDRIAALKREYVQISGLVEARRQALLRSNGEVEALKRLMRR